MIVNFKSIDRRQHSIVADAPTLSLLAQACAKAATTCPDIADEVLFRDFAIEINQVLLVAGFYGSDLQKKTKKSFFEKHRKG